MTAAAPAGITAIGNTAANRQLTFGVRDRRSILRDQAVGLGALGIALASVVLPLIRTLVGGRRPATQPAPVGSWSPT